MINGVTMKILADDYILRALQEDVTSEDVTTNAVMPMPKQGKAQLICKETGIIAGLTIFERVFQLLDSKSEFTGFFQDGDVVKKGEDVTASENSKRNVENTFRELLNMDIIPVVNENDTVSIDELDGPHFGDNDTLSAVVATSFIFALPNAYAFMLVTVTPSILLGIVSVPVSLPV